MGWFSNLIDTVKGSSSVDFLLVPDLDLPSLPEEPAFARDSAYVELYVDSLRLDKSRKFATRFHGLVYSFVTLARQGDGNAEFAAVSKPDKIAELDEDSLGRVITVNKQMMGAVPWRGGDLQLQLGLFSIKTGNLLSPVIDFVTRVSETAGVSFIGAVKPFVPLITEGMDMIAGQTDDSRLQVGMDTSLKLEGKKSSAFAIIATDKTNMDRSKITVDPNDSKLLYDGQPMQETYCVFSLRSAARKADWGEIPEIKEAFATLSSAVRSGKQNDASEALTVFRRTVIFSQDLIPSDAKLLVQKADEMMEYAFGGGGISASSDLKANIPATLADMNIYGD
ncbi:MAG: hypothetical protein AAGK01_04035 [Pseudomonadota bacterium]